MLFTALLLVLLLPLVLLQHVSATHAICTWQPDPSPSNAGLVLHCTAQYVQENSTQGFYQCPRSKQLVATWGHLRSGIINFGESRTFVCLDEGHAR